MGAIRSSALMEDAEEQADSTAPSSPLCCEAVVSTGYDTGVKATLEDDLRRTTSEPSDDVSAAGHARLLRAQSLISLQPLACEPWVLAFSDRGRDAVMKAASSSAIWSTPRHLKLAGTSRPSLTDIQGMTGCFTAVSTYCNTPCTAAKDHTGEMFVQLAVWSEVLLPDRPPVREVSCVRSQLSLVSWSTPRM